MSLPGFAHPLPPPAPGDRLVPQEITCESVEGPACRWRCDGLADFDECYQRCLADRCRDPAWWPPENPYG